MLYIYIFMFFSRVSIGNKDSCLESMWKTKSWDDLSDDFTTGFTSSEYVVFRNAT